MKGRTAEATLAALSLNTAEAKLCPPTASFPAVLPISRLAVLMELAACGSAVRAMAAYRQAPSRVHRLTVIVFDESGLIASAEHSRAVIVERSFSGMAGR